MDFKCEQLAQSGYKIVSLSGDYCCAFRGHDEYILRWDGSRWVFV